MRAAGVSAHPLTGALPPGQPIALAPRPPLFCVKEVRPPLNHARTFFHVIRTMVGGAHGVLLFVRELPLDRVGSPQAAFIEDRRCKRPEPVRGSAMVIAHAIDRVEHGVLADRLRAIYSAGKQ